jgi:hypothetical protein
MNKSLSLAFLLLTLLCFTNNGSAQTQNYYNIPETVTFDSVQYKLSASYHPQDNYYKQEYIPAGESPDHFNKMVTIDFLITDGPAKDLLVSKVRELIELKKSDPVVQYEMRRNPEKDEYILDFVFSKDIGSKSGLVERNVYRYINYTDSAGHKGILLFAISQRGYGDNITAFFGRLLKTRGDDIKKLGQHDIPKIEIK